MSVKYLKGGVPMKDMDNLQKKLSLPVKALFAIFFTYFFLFRSHASDEAMRTVVYPYCILCLVTHDFCAASGGNDRMDALYWTVLKLLIPAGLLLHFRDRISTLSLSLVVLCAVVFTAIDLYALHKSK